MDSSLPKYYRLITIFILVLIFGGMYFYNFKISPAYKSNTQSEDSSISNAYFIPPASTTKEVEVRGKVVVALPDERGNATHKILDDNGNTVVYAYTNDDKLKQQENNVVTLVGDIPLSSQLSSDTVMEVKYISFK